MQKFSAPHFLSLSMDNFRGFKKEKSIPFAPLTFLVGPNSSGKSSILDALLLIAQSNVLPSFDSSFVPLWVGPLVDLGSFNDAVYEHNTSLKMKIGFELTLEPSSRNIFSPLKSDNRPVKYDYIIGAGKDDPVGSVRKVTITDVISAESLIISVRPTAALSLDLKILGRKYPLRMRRDFAYPIRRPYSRIARHLQSIIAKQSSAFRGKKAAWKRIIAHLQSANYDRFIGYTQRVSSGRSPPERWYTVDESRGHRRLSATRGKSVFDTINPALVEAANAPRRIYANRERMPPTSGRLNKILSRIEIASKISTSSESPSQYSIDVQDSVTKITSNIIDVGFGASQIIPVISACLSGGVAPLYIEQPEIHLHPRAQGEIAEFLCDVSSQRQLVVETHSPHMINRARLMIAKGKISSKHVIINYVYRTPQGSKVRSIPIAENGDFEAPWPEGFFVERYEDTMALLQLKSRKGK